MGKMELTVECEKCGRDFKSGYVVENSTDISYRGNKAQCPHCGHMNPVEDRTIRKV